MCGGRWGVFRRSSLVSLHSSAHQLNMATQLLDEFAQVRHRDEHALQAC